MWWKLTHEMMMASLEAQRVVALRMLKLSKGGRAAEKEAQRMVTEKLAAAFEAAGTLATGGSHGKVLRRYRTIMKANSKRLAPKRGRKRK